MNPAPAATSVATATPNAANSVASSLTPFPTLWINELQADNLNGITNGIGQRAPWIELFNPGSNNVSLSGIYLANNYTNLLQWPFPTNATIAAGQFKIIFADGFANLSTTNELHANFVLPSRTGSLALTRLANDGQPQVLDYVDYENINLNDSYGSYPNGQSFDRQEFFQATPGAQQQRRRRAAALAHHLHDAGGGLHTELRFTAQPGRKLRQCGESSAHQYRDLFAGQSL